MNEQLARHIHECTATARCELCGAPRSPEDDRQESGPSAGDVLRWLAEQYETNRLRVHVLLLRIGSPSMSFRSMAKGTGYTPARMAQVARGMAKAMPQLREFLGYFAPTCAAQRRAWRSERRRRRKNASKTRRCTPP